MRQKYGADLSAEQQLQWLHSSQQASHQHHEQRHGSNLPQNLAPDPQQWHTLLQPADTTAQVTAQQEQEQQQQPLIPMGAYTQREQHLQQQEAAGELEFAYVLNDGQPINMIRQVCSLLPIDQFSFSFRLQQAHVATPLPGLCSS
eukprot:GHUV01029223.1.p1 GENE.GHUV01029223.1~~GHUV01029223.1.p1  ORF type:complete len:145 (+),score=53.95 GHUV01029223.1:320-754(+)